MKASYSSQGKTHYFGLFDNAILAASVYAKARYMLANRPSPASSSSSVLSIAPTTPAIAPEDSVDNSDADGDDEDGEEEDDDDDEDEDGDEEEDGEARFSAPTELQSSTTGVIITTAKFDDVIKNGLINIKQCHVHVDIRLAPDNLPLLLKPKTSGTSIYQGVDRIGKTNHTWRVSLIVIIVLKN
jgi:hypothetical protein